MRILPALRSALEDALRFEIPVPGKKWTLRNLTTRIANTFALKLRIVRLSSLTSKTPLRFLCTLHFLCGSSGLAQIYQAATYSSNHQILNRRGVWTAHRFDVIPFAEVVPADIRSTEGRDGYCCEAGAEPSALHYAYTRSHTSERDL